MARVILDNRIRVRVDEVSSNAVARLRQAFTHANPAYGKSRNPDEIPQYETWLDEGDGTISLPRGGLEIVRRVLSDEGHFVDLYDGTTWEYPEPGIPDHLLEQRSYQGEMIDAADVSRTCVLRAPTGSGKTSAGIGFIARKKRRTLVVVWTAALLTQWVERIETELGIPQRQVGIVRGSRTKVRPITVGMQQSILSRLDAGDDEIANSFDVVLVDELQRFAAPTLFRTIDPMRARYRIGVSADETRKDEKEFLIYDLFGAVAKAVAEEELITSGAIVDVEVAVVPTKFTAPWYRWRQDFKRLLDEMVADEARNRLILKLAGKTAQDGHQVLVFTHRVDHARMIDRMLVGAGVPSGLLLGGAENEPEFDRTRLGIKRGVIRAAVGTYTAIAQGIDLPSVSRGIASTPIANNRQQTNQVKGRLSRPSEGKKIGKLAVLWDRSVYGRKAIENLVRGHRTVRVWSGKEWVAGSEFLRIMREGGAGVRV